MCREGQQRQTAEASGPVVAAGGLQAHSSLLRRTYLDPVLDRVRPAAVGTGACVCVRTCAMDRTMRESRLHRGIRGLIWTDLSSSATDDGTPKGISNATESFPFPAVVLTYLRHEAPRALPAQERGAEGGYHCQPHRRSASVI